MLEFYIFKLKKDGCTMDEINAATKTLQENLPISGTIRDFSKFYNKPENQVRATISRKLIATPKRRLLYPFHNFSKIVPDSWRNKEG